MLETLLKIDPEDKTSLQLQIREQVAKGILRGQFPLNKPLPSSRKLAKELKIARNTVMLAYEHLEDDGYLIAKQRSGYFINPEVLKGRAQQTQSEPSASKNPPDWHKTIKLQPSSDAYISKPANWQSYEYPFIYGQFDQSLFPRHHWRECSRDSVSVGGVQQWASDHVDMDDPELIDEIRTRILPRRGIWAEEDQIMITVGTQQALFLISKLLLDSDSLLGIENPGYPDMRKIANLHGISTRPLPLDSEGLLVDEHLHDCDAVFCTPSHQSPTTVTMPLERRSELLAMASQHNFLIIEDDYESELNFVAEHTPALKSLDKEGRVIYTGSFSKMLAPGLRLGYMVADREVIKEATAFRRLMLRHPPSNNQRAMALFIHRGYYDSLVARLIATYEERWSVMASALSEHLRDFSVPSSYGGSSFWLSGPQQLEVKNLQAQARDQGILIESGAVHFCGQDKPDNFFRLGYSSIDSEKIKPGIQKLARIISDLCP